MSQKTELLKKVKALAERGSDGEKDNAQEILRRLMAKHGISEADLEEEMREIAWFSYQQETERRLLSQIIYMVTGEGGFAGVGSQSGRKRKKIGAECTAAERLEIEANYDFFKIAMKQELEVFFTAFAHKNNLFPLQNKIKPTDERLSQEDKKRAFKVGLMMEGMERYTLRKMING